MKKILNILTALLLAVFSTSCLESNLEELEVYSGNEITSIAGAYYRYYGTDVIPGSGEQQVKQYSLWYGATERNVEAGTISFQCTYYSNAPQEVKDNFSFSNMVVIVNLSSAATIRPLDGAPKLGVPGDWSKPNKYEVTAADGSKKVWTITVLDYEG